jgi:hypothetical protein
MAGGLRVTFAFNPDAPFFDRVFTRFTKDISDLSDAFREIATSFYIGERAQFESSGSAATGQWAPLSPRYAAWKARNFPNKGILRRTDQMFHAATGDKSAGAVLDIKPMQMRMGIDERSAVGLRARLHQTGTRRMPARPWLVVTQDQKRSWERIIARRLNEAAKEAAAAINAKASMG